MKQNSNIKIYSKILLGTFLISGFLLINSSNNFLYAYTGKPEITNLNKYCFADDPNGSPIHKETQTCTFTHRTNFKKNLLSDFQISTREIFWSHDYESWDTGATKAWSMYNKMTKGQNYSVAGSPELNYKKANQTGQVTISQHVLVNDIWHEEAVVNATIKTVAGKNPRCWVKPIPMSGSGLTRIDGTNWFIYDEEADKRNPFERRVYWSLDGADTADGTSGDSYEERGGSSLNHDARTTMANGKEISDWQIYNENTESFPLEWTSSKL